MFASCSTEDLMETYAALGGAARAIEVQRLAILAELDHREAYRLDGCLDAAQWVATTDAVPVPVARRRVETALALEELPAIAEVAAEGRLSMAQLESLVVIADHENDAAWAERGPGETAAALEVLAKQRRRVKRSEAQRQRVRRSLRWWRDPNGLGVRLAGLLPDAEAEVVRRELERRAGEAGPNEQGVYEPYESRCADALVEVCASAAAAEGRAEVVLHVPVGIADASPTLPDGTPVAVETIERFACDGTARLLVENPDGSVAGYGRRKRIVPDKMRERLRLRDRGRCRWGPCDRRRGLRAHHIRHWIRNGPTDESNCVLLCPAHHALVHEGGWDIIGDANGTLEFRRPGGTTLPAAPAPAPPDLLGRFGFDAA